MLALAGQAHRHRGRLRMLGDIRQRFLGDAEQAGGLVQLQLDVLAVRDEAAFDAGLARKFLHLPVQRGDEAQVQHGGAQVQRNAVHGVDAAVDQGVDIGGFFLQLGIIRRQAARQHGQRHLDRRQIAAQVVVQFARQARALVFLDLVDMRRQLGQARARLAHFDLFQPAFRDIRHDAFPLHRAVRQRARRGAQVDPFDVLPGIDPDAAFPVPAPQGGLGHLHRFQIRGAVVGQDQLVKQFRARMQLRRAQPQQGLAAVAQVGEGGAPVPVQAELVYETGRIRDDGVEARLHLGQGGGRRLRRAQVFAHGQDQGAPVVAGARQVQGERILAAVAPLRLQMQDGLRADGVVEGGQLACRRLQRERQRQQFLARVVQVGAGAVVDVQQLQAGRVVQIDFRRRRAHGGGQLRWRRGVGHGGRFLHQRRARQKAAKRRSTLAGREL